MHLSSCVVDNTLLFFGKSRQYRFVSVEGSWKRIKVISIISLERVGSNLVGTVKSHVQDVHQSQTHRFEGAFPTHLIMKVPEFLSGIGREVETHIPKLETAIGDLLKLLVARTLNIKVGHLGSQISGD
ncbi:hypothetical protein F2Q69_00024934 [Brassica cretica]|uniref:Small ribosomal subunit protein mS41 SAM domain-containing protein n=1 Tax=Brassica cretica TaxID=69181 RepID=A0A8S9QIX6_BRACR|nr:hypothetical protein F2Q69_00024934 [Brassica cretica]